MRVTLADTTVDAYEAFAKKQGKPVDQVIEHQLARFKTLEPGTRAVVIGKDDIEKLTIALGGIPVKDAADLVARVENLAAVSFQHIRLNFSPQHLAELAHRAERQGKSVEAVIRDTVNRMAEDFFWKSGGGESVLIPATPKAEVSHSEA
jgi:hypothetical protein